MFLDKFCGFVHFEKVHTLIQLFFNISASFAEFERDLIRERTKLGLEAARARGRKGGSRQGMTKDAEQKANLAETYYK